MSWLESHQELRDHPKTARLRRRLGVSLPQAVGHLHLLWWWALDYAPSGDLSAFDADVIADAGGWEDEAGLFVRALIGAGFLDDDLRIHDWEDYAGRLIDKREANARRKRAARYARRAELGDTSYPGRVAGHPADGTPDVSRTSGECLRLPDLTGPDLTGPDRTGHPPNLLPREGGTFPDDVTQRLSQLPDDLDAAAFHTATEAALVALGFATEREVWVQDRGDGRRGRLDLVAERDGVRIAFELDDRTPRRNSLDKLRRADCELRAVVLRCPTDGPLGRVPPGITVIEAGAWPGVRPSAPTVPENLTPPTAADRALWDSARDRLTDGWLPANAEKIAAIVLLGRDPSGRMCVGVPPGAASVARQHQLAAALVGAGDPFGAGVVIVEGT